MAWCLEVSEYPERKARRYVLFIWFPQNLSTGEIKYLLGSILQQPPFGKRVSNKHGHWEVSFYSTDKGAADSSISTDHIRREHSEPISVMMMMMISVFLKWSGFRNVGKALAKGFKGDLVSGRGDVNATAADSTVWVQDAQSQNSISKLVQYSIWRFFNISEFDTGFVNQNTCPFSIIKICKK